MLDPFVQEEDAVDVTILGIHHVLWAVEFLRLSFMNAELRQIDKLDVVVRESM